ncbi:NAD+ synthase (glutamine-hydrolysing) [Thermoflavifilum aggregans]|uniref:Glutamine-dependent NAD(+) synthetase n=1 Tax=Thermoflavifilum aggregans TaxID=454188 RepID=A0A2M9CSU3_9BACT|nr:NAD+ synthase [Thermoflavifilum aggregans]PJJ74977.1 NAD+ synthase (glutamine-hydrolysing) [Thermoflavifilum aggregans]
MRIALIQQNYHIGDFDSNADKIIQGIEQARSLQADLVVFSELCICGYPPMDLLEFDDFIAACENTLQRICAHAEDIGVIVGAPSRNPSPRGRRLFNSAYLLYDGRIQDVIHKTLLPTYDVFDESRYFEPATSWHCIQFQNKKIALTICEDIWNVAEPKLYQISPLDMLIREQPDCIINISASPFDYDHEQQRIEIIRENVRQYHLPLIYCNAVGAQTELVFDGASLVFNARAELVRHLPSFEEALDIIELEKLSYQPAITQQPPASTQTLRPEFQIDRIHDALLLGIRDYFSKMGLGSCVIGSSGGIDSAVATALACEALGAARVLSVMMPSEFSSSASVEDAVELSRRLGNRYEIIPIRNIYHSFLDTLKPVFQDRPFGLAEENIQARIRGNLLMAIANKFGYILLNTSNKSELAVGYGTLYGDMAGGLSVLGDVYKLQVYALARYLNRNQEIIPLNIIHKAPSAELRPGQKDTDSLPPYERLDPILYQYIEQRKTIPEIIAMGFDPALVQQVVPLVNRNEYKRNQFCPIIRVSSKAFGRGRRIPIVGKY